MSERRASPTAEDYLKQIHALSEEPAAGPVKTTALAEALGVSPAAVTEMVKRLAGMGLVDYERYRGASLSETGRRAALGVLRRHRLWETFLYQKLHLPWAKLHDAACRLEHATDDAVADALADFLGSPSVDPHGHPIPLAEGRPAPLDASRLDTLAPGQAARVQERRGSDPLLLAHLDSLGLRPGVSVRLLSQHPFGGPLELEVAGAQRWIGRAAAATVRVHIEDGGPSHEEP